MPQLSPERIGPFEMRVTLCAPTDESSTADRRVEVLTAWLLSCWLAQHPEGEHVQRDR
jgi:hypothetical protein